MVLQEIQKVQTLVFDKTGTLTEGKPVVTDIIGDEVEVLGLAASLEEASQHPLAEAIVKRATETGLVLHTVENFQALHGKGVSGKSMENKFYLEMLKCWMAWIFLALIKIN